jgi:hypothetical protein
MSDYAAKCDMGLFNGGSVAYRYAAQYAGDDYTGLMSDAQFYNGYLIQQEADSIYTTGVP